jgi:hypothetical protein
MNFRYIKSLIEDNGLGRSSHLADTLLVIEKFRARTERGFGPSMPSPNEMPVRAASFER